MVAPSVTVVVPHMSDDVSGSDIAGELFLKKQDRKAERVAFSQDDLGSICSPLLVRCGHKVLVKASDGSSTVWPLKRALCE